MGARLGKRHQFARDPNASIPETIEFGGNRISVWYKFKDYRLISVILYYDSELFEEVVMAYTAKFGVAPHELTEEILTTRIGTVYTNYIATWETDSGPFVVRRYGTEVDNGYAVLYSPAYVELREKEREKTEE